MKARDVMTAKVVSVSSDATTGEIAKILQDNHISAAPVVDKHGLPIGMVSEGDLIGRDDSDREARREWWLTLLADGETLSPVFIESLGSVARRAHDVMSKPLISVSEDTEIDEIARLLLDRGIKRVPVMRDGLMVGIVSRANLLGAMAAPPEKKSSGA